MDGQREKKGFKAKLLWENPNPNQAFGPRTLDIQVDYKHLIYVLKQNISNNRFVYIISDETNGEYRFNVYGGNFGGRNITYNRNQNIVIGIGKAGAGMAESNTTGVPVKIYGINIDL